jgi:hypothetical protein
MELINVASFLLDRKRMAVQFLASDFSNASISRQRGSLRGRITFL